MQASTTGGKPEKVKPRKIVLPRFTHGSETQALNLQTPFHQLLRYLLIEEDVPNNIRFRDMLNMPLKRKPGTRQTLRINYPFAMLLTGADNTIHAVWRERKTEEYRLTTELTRLLHDGFCFESGLERQQGEIVFEWEEQSLYVVVRDDRESFFRRHKLAWWYVSPISQLISLGEVRFRKDGFHRDAFERQCCSAFLPEARHHRVFAAIVRCEADED